MEFRANLPFILLGLGIVLVGFLIFTYRQHIVQYYRETRAEIAKVSWPTRQESINLTIVVLVTVTVSSIFLGLFDALFTWIFAQLLQ